MLLRGRCSASPSRLMTKRSGRLGLRMTAVLVVAFGLLWALPVVGAAAITSAAPTASTFPGGLLSSTNKTPFGSSTSIDSARWIGRRYDPPANQNGDILPTVWGEDGSTYVLMDDGGVDTPVAGSHWRQSLARVSGSPPYLTFKHVGDPLTPAPRTWKQIGGDMDRDDGPLGPYYSIGFADVDGVFYATLQRNWNWSANTNYTGLVGVAYSTTHGETRHVVKKPFPAPLGNLTFVITAGEGGGPDTDGYVYAIGTEREFNASKLILGRTRPGVANLTDPTRWEWYAGAQTTGSSQAGWSSSLGSAALVLSWNNHITYPQMSYDAPLHRYLLTFTYSYFGKPPAIWKGGAELVILESPTPWGPFSFVASSRNFGPSNGYGAGLPPHNGSAPTGGRCGSNGRPTSQDAPKA